MRTTILTVLLLTSLSWSAAASSLPSGSRFMRPPNCMTAALACPPSPIRDL